MRKVLLPPNESFTHKRLGRSRLIGGRILDALDGGRGGEGRLADGVLGGDAKGVGSGKESNNGEGGEAHTAGQSGRAVAKQARSMEVNIVMTCWRSAISRAAACCTTCDDIIERIQKLHVI
jgi:hypothetical protein